MPRISLSKIFALLVLAGAFAWWHTHGAVRHAPGVLVPGAPEQQIVPPRELAMREGYHLTALARYTLVGRVLSTKRYRYDRGSDLVPVDVALGWRSMSDQTVLDALTISQSNRFYFFKWPHQPPRPLQELAESSANVHVIPQNRAVCSLIGRLRAGEIVRMCGYLVEARGEKGAVWRSSLSRSDSGNGACELFYVEEAVLREPGDLSALPDKLATAHHATLSR